MKTKFKSIILGLVLAIPILTPAMAHADTATLSLSPASKSVAKGAVLSVSVRENSGAEPVNSVQANLTYPANLLDFVSISSSSAWGIVAQNTGGGGSVQIARGANPAVSGSQVVATVLFRAKADSGTASINFAAGSAVISANSNADVKSGESGGNYTLTAPAPAPAAAPKDTTPPTISSKIVVQEITATTAVVTWTTSEPATSEVNYGPSKSYGIAAVDANAVTNHKVTLTSPLIAPGTKYHLMVKSVDSSGNAVSSADSTFITIGATLEAKVISQTNKPVSGAKVTFGEVSATTDKNGKATFKENLPLGKLTGVVTYKNKQAPATVQLDTLLDKNGKANTATFKIDVSSDLWLKIVILILALALIGALLYRRKNRRLGGPSGGAGAGTGAGVAQSPPANFTTGLKSLPKRLKGLFPKKDSNTPPTTDNTLPNPNVPAVGIIESKSIEPTTITPNPTVDSLPPTTPS